MWKIVREFPRALVSTLAWFAGVAAATLPKRWWPMLDPYVPVTDSAAIAAILTILLAGAIGVPGFIDHTTQQVSLNNRAVLAEAQKAAARPEAEETLSQRDWGRMFVGVSSLSLFTFIFLTPAGWASTYLGISGTWRAIAASVDDPFGDPILTGVDALLLRGARGARAQAERQQREALEGPQVPDRVVRGSHSGITGADLVTPGSRSLPARCALRHAWVSGRAHERRGQGVCGVKVAQTAKTIVRSVP